MSDETPEAREDDGGYAEYITAKAGSKGVTAKHQWRPGRTLEEAIEIYGEDFVFEGFRKTGTRLLQNAIRSILSGGGDQAKVTEVLGDDYRPDVSRRPTRMSDEERVAKSIESMSEEQLAALLSKVRDQLQTQKAAA